MPSAMISRHVFASVMRRSAASLVSFGGVSGASRMYLLMEKFPGQCELSHAFDDARIVPNYSAFRKRNDEPPIEETLNLREAGSKKDPTSLSKSGRTCSRRIYFANAGLEIPRRRAAILALMIRFGSSICQAALMSTLQRLHSGNSTQRLLKSASAGPTES